MAASELSVSSFQLCTESRTVISLLTAPIVGTHYTHNIMITCSSVSVSMHHLTTAAYACEDTSHDVQAENGLVTCFVSQVYCIEQHINSALSVIRTNNNLLTEEIHILHTVMLNCVHESE